MSKQAVTLIAFTSLIVVAFQNCGRETVSADAPGLDGSFHSSNGESTVRMFQSLDGTASEGLEEEVVLKEIVPVEPGAEEPVSPPVLVYPKEKCKKIRNSRIMRVGELYVLFPGKRAADIPALRKRAKKSEKAKERLRKLVQKNPHFSDKLDAKKYRARAVRDCYNMDPPGVEPHPLPVHPIEEKPSLLEQRESLEKSILKYEAQLEKLKLEISMEETSDEEKKILREKANTVKQKLVRAYERRDRIDQGNKEEPSLLEQRESVEELIQHYEAQLEKYSKIFEEATSDERKEILSKKVESVELALEEAYEKRDRIDQKIEAGEDEN